MIEWIGQWFRQAKLLQALKAEIRLVDRENERLRRQVHELKEALEEARKNDHRGTDGRFKAAPKPHDEWKVERG